MIRLYFNINHLKIKTNQTDRKIDLTFSIVNIHKNTDELTGIFNLSVTIIDTLQSFLKTMCFPPYNPHIKFLFFLLLVITHQVYLYYSACLSIMISYSVLQFFYLLSLKCKLQERKIRVTHFIFLPTPLASRSCILEWSQTLYAARMTLNIWSPCLRR